MTQPPPEGPEDRPEGTPEDREQGGWATPDPSAPGPYGQPSYPPPPPPGYGQQPPTPPGYGQQGYSSPYGATPPAGQPGGGGWAGYAAPQTSPKATWALVTGIIALVMGCCGVLGLVGIASVVLGVQARRDIAASQGRLTGDGAALAGIILGAIGAVSGLVMGLIGFALFTSGDSSFTFNS
jgi:hypothetical protein